MAEASQATAATTIDAREIDRFAALAESWWDPNGPMRPLHRLNPARLGYIRDRLCRHFDRDTAALRPFEGLRIADIGCGGGLLSEPLARLGAQVVGLDAAADSIEIARLHAEAAGVPVDYRCAAAEELAAAGESFDAVISMEVVEHVANLPLFLDACAALAAPGGVLLLATLNRTVKAFVMAVVGAEYVLRWLPRGTHRWERFVRPAELVRALRPAGVEVRDISGMTLDLRTGEWRVSTDRDVNYLLYGVRRTAPRA